MSDALLKKLQHRAGTPVLALWAPPELGPVLDGWEAGGVTVRRRMRGDAPFVLACFRSRAEIAERAERVAASLGGDDPVLWLAYPKKSSKRYASDVGRDDSWQPFGDLGFEPVRQVALDDDWSALRFRRVEQVRTMTRSRAISARGRERLARRAAPDDPAVEAWLDARPEPRGSALRAVHRAVREAAPELAPSLGERSVNYGPFHYRYASGREDDAHRVVLADNARNASLYVLATDENGYLVEQRAGELGKVSVGKSCIRFRRADDLDLDALRRLLRAAADQHAAEARVGPQAAG